MVAVLGVLLASMGIGTFMSVAYTYISDLFPKEMRGRSYTVFLILIDATTALGYLLSGVLYSYVHPTAIYWLGSGLVLTMFAISFRLPETLTRRVKRSERE